MGNSTQQSESDGGTPSPERLGSHDYFVLDGIMRHYSCIRQLRLDGGPTGFGCWGHIMLEGENKPTALGDGSYFEDGKHIEHRLAGERSCPDFGFKQLRAVMRDHGMTEQFANT